MSVDVAVGVSRDGIGGSVTVAIDLAASSARHGWAPTIICNSDNPPYNLARQRGLNVLSQSDAARLRYRPEATDGNLLKRASKRVFLYRSARRILSKNRPAIIHAHDESFALAWGAASRNMSIPLVWHIHRHHRQSVTDDYLLNRSDFIVFVSDANRQRFEGRRIPPSATLLNGVDLSRFRPKIPDRSKSVVIGFIGNLVSRKRPEWVVDAAAKLISEGCDIKVVFAGSDFSGESAVKLRARAEQYRLGSRFEYLGYQSDIPGLLRSIDILALPSEEGQEAFPRVIAEALASGLPIVATRVAGIPEGVSNGKDGFLTDPHKFDEFVAALGELCRNGSLRATFGLNARKTAEERFSLVDAAGRLDEIYRELLQKRAKID